MANTKKVSQGHDMQTDLINKLLIKCYFDICFVFSNNLSSFLCPPPRYATARLNFYFEKKEEYLGLTMS